MKNKALLATIIGSLALVGCGGGSSGGSSDTGGGSSPTTSVSGYAIDGYISGATVFLDKNFNGVLDNGEPNAITDSSGLYTLNLEGETCKDSAPLIVDVPANAIDLDNPNSPIGDAYTLTMPPNAYLVSGEQKDVHVTPLTTMLWSSIYSEALKQEIQFDCNELSVANSEQSVWLWEQLQDSEVEVAANLGVSEPKDLYSDYVDNGDNALHTTAQNIVEDLKEVEKVKDSAPSGSEAFLMNHSDLASYGITANASVKYVLTVTELNDGSYSEKIENLENSSLIYFEKVGQKTENTVYLNNVEKVFVSSDGVSGSCEIVDISKEKANTYYEVTTKEKTDSGVTSIGNCPQQGTSEQIIKTVQYSEDDGVVTTVTSEATYSIPVEEMPVVNTISDVESFVVAVKSQVLGVEGFESDFDDNALTPDSWVRTYKEAHNIIFGSDTKSHQVTRDQSGIWTKTLPIVDEGFCMSNYVVDNGNNPMDDWDQETTTNSSAVWIKVGKVEGIYEKCVESQSHWGTNTIYWPVTNLTPGF